MKWMLTLPLVAVIFLSGCAGDTAVAFGSAGKPLLQAVKTDIGRKDASKVERVIELVNNNHKKGNMSTDERDAMIKICGYMSAGEWEEASKLAEACWTETGKELGGGATK